MNRFQLFQSAWVGVVMAVSGFAVAAEEAPQPESDANKAAVAVPVPAEPVQVFGWQERVTIKGMTAPLLAKLDTGAKTCSIHVEKREMFERDGKKWVRFVITDPRTEDSHRVRMEAPLVRIAQIKEPGGAPQQREVVMLSFKIGDRNLRAEFTLNNRSNMVAPVLIGRILLKELGVVHPDRTFIADEKIFR